jgi:hypothetical protein
LVRNKKTFFRKINFFDLEEMVKKETSGDHQRGILAVIRCIKSRPHFFAEQLRNAIKVEQFF